MSVGRANKISIGLTRTIDIVGIMPTACNETMILCALDGRTYACAAHHSPHVYVNILEMNAFDRIIKATGGGRLIKSVILGLGVCHSLSACRYSLNDVVIARATAQIAFQFLTNYMLIELMAFAMHDINSIHNHAGRAKATLQTMIVAKSFLHGV
jgi:hypothetical protein